MGENIHSHDLALDVVAYDLALISLAVRQILELCLTLYHFVLSVSSGAIASSSLLLVLQANARLSLASFARHVTVTADPCLLLLQNSLKI